MSHPVMRFIRRSSQLIALSLAGACGSSSSGPPVSEAMRHGVGTACASNSECTEPGQTCLPFKGGYCGIEGCGGDAGACPAGSACVQHTDGKSYCFLICVEKGECNIFRAPEVEANCSSNITFTDATKGKACVPPS